MATNYCVRCGARGGSLARDVFDPAFCWRCFDGTADAARAAQIIEAAEERWDAARMLGDIADARALPILIEALDHSTDGVRRAILGALSLIGDPAAIPSVIAMLDEPDRRVREAAVRALGDLGGPAALDALAGLLEDGELATLAAIALAWHRDERAFDTLIAAKSNDRPMRNAARTPTIALAWLNDRRAVPLLVERLADQEAAYRSVDDIQRWAITQRAREIASVLMFFGGEDAVAAVDRARSVFEHLNPSLPFGFVKSSRRFPGLEEDLADPRRTIPKWSLELREVTEPISEPVTKFGGQPVWLDEPTWPLTNDSSPMTFFAQFSVPGMPGRLAYLFIDPEDEGNGTAGSGANALFVQPGGTPRRHMAQGVGPTYVSSWSDMNRFEPRMRLGLIERRAAMTEGRDPADWTTVHEEDVAGEADWNKVGGTPLWLQYPEIEADGDRRFLFQFTAAAIGHEFADGAECYGFISDDGSGAFVWQCH